MILHQWSFHMNRPQEGDLIPVVINMNRPQLCDLTPVVIYMNRPQVGDHTSGHFI